MQKNVTEKEESALFKLFWFFKSFRFDLLLCCEYQQLQMLALPLVYNIRM